MTTSVVMPVHGNWPVVSRALDALRRERTGREVIVVDDASPDETAERIEASTAGLTVIRNTQAAGFGTACNQGAEQATGSLICFLNSDAIVAPGALAALERAMQNEHVGAAAPLLLNKDGTLQEAGGAIGCDGATAPLGRGAAADDPAWCFRREVDYGSAACLAVDRGAFERLGGFDSAYAPAYYEDADLCLRLAESGLATMLEPQARVTHLQYGSGSESRARALVERNRRTFLERWGDRLAHRPIVVTARDWPHRALALRDAIALTRLLVFDDAQLAASLASLWRHARVTLVGDGAPQDVERAAPAALAAWLEERRFHYSAVLSSRELQPSVVAALDRSQPQAERVVVGQEDDVVSRLTAAAIARPQEAPRG